MEFIQLKKNNPPLSRSVSQSWQQFEKLVCLSRQTPSAKNIHQLRISSHRLEAALRLANCLQLNVHPKSVINLAKTVRGRLSRLRDYQVMSKKLESKRFSTLEKKNHRDFSHFILKRKTKAETTSVQILKNISLRRNRIKVKRLIQKLEAAENKRTKNLIRGQLSRRMTPEVLRFSKRVDVKKTKDLGEIHGLRKQVKNLRYQAECMRTVTGATRMNLKALKQFQSLTGKIQNDSVFLQTLDKYLNKKARGAEAVKAQQIKKNLKKEQKTILETEYPQFKAIEWQR